MLTLVKQEWQLLKANKVYWCCLLLLGCLTGIAFWLGSFRAAQSILQHERFTTEQTELQLLVVEAVKDQTKREGPKEMRRSQMEAPPIDLEQLFHRELNDIEKGRFRVLWNFASGRFAVYHLPWRTWKAPAVLEEVTAGESNHWPNQYLIDRTRQGKTLTPPAVSNPFRSMIGTFDVSTLVLIVMPLFMILLLYDVVSKDRELGVWQLIMSQGTPYAQVIAVRTAIRCFGIALLLNSVLCICIVASRNVSSDATILLVTAFLVLGINCYVFFWGSLAWLISALGMQSLTNALVLLLLWIAFVVLIPLALFETTALRHPVLPMNSLAAREIAIRQKLRDDREQLSAQAKAQAQRGDSTPTPTPKSQDAQVQTILRELRPQREMVSTEIDKMVADYQGRSEALTSLAPFSPVMSMQNIFELAAGNGLSHFVDFVRQTKDFHKAFLVHFQELPHSRTTLALEDIEGMPKYHPSPIQHLLGWRPFTSNISILASWSILQFVLGCLAFRFRSV